MILSHFIRYSEDEAHKNEDKISIIFASIDLQKQHLTLFVIIQTQIYLKSLSPNMEVKPQTEPETKAALLETDLNMDFLKTEQEQDWLNFEDFDKHDWNQNIETEGVPQTQNETAYRRKYKTKKTKRNHESSYFPSFSEIQKSLQVVRRAFPQTFTDETIDRLFHSLMNRFSHPSRMPAKSMNPNLSLAFERFSDFKKSFSQANFINPRPIGLTDGKNPISKRRKHQFLPKMPGEQNLLNHSRQDIFFGKKEVFNPHKGIASRLDSIWVQQFENTLLSLYKKGHQFSFIRDHFQEEYPQYKEVFTVNSLRGKFYKIIRQTVRKLYTFIERIGRQHYPRTMKIGFNIIQNIMYFQEGRDLRCLFIDLYFCDKPNRPLVDRIIDGISHFIKETKDLQGKHKQIETE